jgi:hypothetical protein
MKLFRVTCRRATDADDDEPYSAAAFAIDKGDAEHLCRSAFADRGYTSFEADEPVDGPFENVQPQVLVFEGRRLNAVPIDEMHRACVGRIPL